MRISFALFFPGQINMFYEMVDHPFFLLWVFLLGLGIARILLPFSGRIASALDIIDHPDDRKIHSKPLPRTGGLAMGLALFFTLIVVLPADSTTLQAYFLGAAIAFFSGLLDDMIDLSPVLKLSGQVLAASAFVLVGGFYLHSFGDLIGFGEIAVPAGLPAAIVTIFCIVGVMNAINLLDGMDGLAAGIVAIAVVFMMLFSYLHGADVWVVICVVLGSVVFAFMGDNHYPAKCFMGDAGSLLLGYSVAAVSVGLVQSDAGFEPVRPIVPAILLSFPIVDTLVVMLKRITALVNPFKPDQVHLHHRLMRLGLHQWGAVNVFYVLMVGIGIFAWQTRNLPVSWRFYALILVFAAIYAAAYLLEKCNINLANWLAHQRRSLRLLAEGLNISPIEKIGPVLSGVLPIMFFSPVIFLDPLPPLFGMTALVAACFILLLFPWTGNRMRLLQGHGILYAACFLLLCFYILVPGRPDWIFPLLYLLGVLSLVWILVKWVTSRCHLIFYPSGFEVIIVLLSWCVPLVLVPMFGADASTQVEIAQVCAIALIFHCFLKLFLHRLPARNITAGICFAAIFLLLGAVALW